jgi:hypothetical protein
MRPIGNQRRERQEDRADLLADLGVVAHPHRDVNSTWAEPSCGRDRHCAMHAKLACFVGGGAHDAATRDAADDDGLVA